MPPSTLLRKLQWYAGLALICLGCLMIMVGLGWIAVQHHAAIGYFLVTFLSLTGGILVCGSSLQ